MRTTGNHVTDWLPEGSSNASSGYSQTSQAVPALVEFPVMLAVEFVGPWPAPGAQYVELPITLGRDV